MDKSARVLYLERFYNAIKSWLCQEKCVSFLKIAECNFCKAHCANIHCCFQCLCNDKAIRFFTVIYIFKFGGVKHLQTEFIGLLKFGVYHTAF